MEQQARLAELQSLRLEVHARLRMQVEILAFFISALSIVFGLVSIQQLYILVLLIPPIALISSLLYVWCQLYISLIGSYIKDEIEPNVPGLNWEHCLRQMVRNKGLVRFFYPMAIPSLFGLSVIGGIVTYFAFWCGGQIILAWPLEILLIILQLFYLSIFALVMYGFKRLLWEF